MCDMYFLKLVFLRLNACSGGLTLQWAILVCLCETCSQSAPMAPSEVPHDGNGEVEETSRVPVNMALERCTLRVRCLLNIRLR
ncbi:hypothetical protein P5V15_011822 [Pogonomyrmex californicus]